MKAYDAQRYRHEGNKGGNHDTLAPGTLWYAQDGTVAVVSEVEARDVTACSGCMYLLPSGQVRCHAVPPCKWWTRGDGKNVIYKTRKQPKTQEVMRNYYDSKDNDQSKVYRIVEAYGHNGNCGTHPGMYERPEYIGRTGTFEELKEQMGREYSGEVVDLCCESEGWNTWYPYSRKSKHFYLYVEPVETV